MAILRIPLHQGIDNIEILNSELSSSTTSWDMANFSIQNECYLMIRTGHCECWDTPLATLPKSNFLNPPIPREPITMRSTLCDSAYEINESVIEVTSSTSDLKGIFDSFSSVSMPASDLAAASFSNLVVSIYVAP